MYIRPNTLLLCIFLFWIFLLYRADSQVEVQIRILLKDKHRKLCQKCKHRQSHHTLISRKMPIPILYFRETTCYPKYNCRKIHPYSRNRFSKILRTFYASRNSWIIVVFLQHKLKEKLPIILMNTLLLYIPLLALTDRGNDRERNKYTRCVWAGGTFFPVVLLCQFLVLAGYRFWSYILMYLEYNTVVASC